MFNSGNSQFNFTYTSPSPLNQTQYNSTYLQAVKSHILLGTFSLAFVIIIVGSFGILDWSGVSGVF